jgi:hypothetical protein
LRTGLIDKDDPFKEIVAIVVSLLDAWYGGTPPESVTTCAPYDWFCGKASVIELAASGDGVGVGLGVGVGDSVGLGVGLGDGVGLGVGLGDGVGLGVGLGDGVGLGVGLGDGVGLGVGLGDGVGLGVAVGFDVGFGVGVGVGVGEAVGVAVGEAVGVGDGLGVGEGDGVGKTPPGAKSARTYVTFAVSVIGVVEPENVTALPEAWTGPATVFQLAEGFDPSKSASQKPFGAVIPAGKVNVICG